MDDENEKKKQKIITLGAIVGVVIFAFVLFAILSSNAKRYEKSWIVSEEIVTNINKKLSLYEGTNVKGSNVNTMIDEVKKLNQKHGAKIPELITVVGAGNSNPTSNPVANADKNKKYNISMSYGVSGYINSITVLGDYTNE